MTEKKKTKEESKKVTNEKPVSLWGLSLEEALQIMLNTKPAPKEKKGQEKIKKGD